MPPKESLFSTLRKTVVFFRLTRTYLRDAALATRAVWRLDGVSRRPPQLWCLCYLDTARHICGDAIESQGCPTRRAAVRDYVSVDVARRLESPAMWVERLRLSRPSVTPVDV